MRILTVIMIFFLVSCFGCKPDSGISSEFTQEDLTGEWEIYRATRNGNVTKSLESGIFVFGADNLVSSNLFESTNSFNFTYDNGTIKIDGEPNITSLKIRRLYNDTLVLSSKMKVFKMEFHLKKK